MFPKVSTDGCKHRDTKGHPRESVQAITISSTPPKGLRLGLFMWEALCRIMSSTCIRYRSEVRRGPMFFVNQKESTRFSSSL